MEAIKYLGLLAQRLTGCCAEALDGIYAASDSDFVHLPFWFVMKYAWCGVRGVRVQQRVQLWDCQGRAAPGDGARVRMEQGAGHVHRRGLYKS